MVAMSPLVYTCFRWDPSHPYVAVGVVVLPSIWAFAVRVPMHPVVRSMG
jgi:hypothetical protein